MFFRCQGYWLFFVMEGNGPASSVYKVLQVVDFYLGSILPCNPVFGVDVSNAAVDVGRERPPAHPETGRTAARGDGCLPRCFSNIYFILNYLHGPQP